MQIYNVSALVSISALALLNVSVVIRSLAPIWLLLDVEMVALSCLFLFGVEHASHSHSVFFLRMFLGASWPNCSPAFSVSCLSPWESSST